MTQTSRPAPSKLRSWPISNVDEASYCGVSNRDAAVTVTATITTATNALAAALGSTGRYAFLDRTVPLS